MSVGRFWSWVKNGTSLRHATNMFNNANQNMTLKMREMRNRVHGFTRSTTRFTPANRRRQKK